MLVSGTSGQQVIVTDSTLAGNRDQDDSSIVDIEKLVVSLIEEKRTVIV